MDIVGKLHELLDASIADVSAASIFIHPDRYSSPHSLLVIARDYEAYTRPFPNWLANVIAQIDSEEARIPLVQNLWEEHGRGTVELGHRNLMRSFVNSIELAISHGSLDRQYFELASTAEACRRINDATRNRGALHGIGTLLALELTNVGQVEALQRGVFAGLPSNVDDRYLTEHASCDTEHAEEIANVARSLVETTEDLDLILDGAWQAVEADRLFWTGLSSSAITAEVA